MVSVSTPTFVEWAVRRGTRLAANVTVAQADSARGRYLYLSGSVDKDELLLSVPLGAVVCAETVLKTEPLGVALSTLATEYELPDRIIVMIFLIFEKFGRSTSSPWSAWLENLASVESPLVRDTNNLRGTPLMDAIVAKKNRLEQEYSALIEPVQIMFAELGVSPDTFSDENFVWADLTFRSRVCTGPFSSVQSNQEQETIYVEGILPFIDFANHAQNDVSARWQVDDANEFVHLIANRPLKDEEICISYGDKSNEELLYQYGFTVPDNEHDTLTLVRPPLDVPGVSFTSENFMYLVQLLGSPPRLQFKSNGPTQQSLDFAILLTANEQALSDLFERTESSTQLSLLANELSQQSHSFTAAYGLLKKVLEIQLENLDQDRHEVHPDVVRYIDGLKCIIKNSLDIISNKQ